MQTNNRKFKTIGYAILFALFLQIVVSAQTQRESTEMQYSENRIGKSVTPFVDYDPQAEPLTEPLTGSRRPYADFFGTGRTSFAVYNRFNPGPLNWKIQSNGSNESRFLSWGRDDFNFTDFINPGYFDGDNKADVAVWRRNSQDGSGTFYINPSTATDSMLVTRWGLYTDSGSKLSADYDGDGRDDLTIARQENGKWVWYYLRSSDNSYRIIHFGVAGAGAGTDTPHPGADYNGDGRADLTVIRRNADGTGTYYIGDSETGEIILVQQWGLRTPDTYVVGDYLGDNRADFAVWRGSQSSGNSYWYIKENGGDRIIIIPFGYAGDVIDTPIRGDYNGDGKDDIAVYRKWYSIGAADNNTFYWLNSPNFDTLGAYKFGELGDVVVTR